MVISREILLEKITATPGIQQIELLVGAHKGERQATQELLREIEAEGLIRQEGEHGPERRYWVK
jgi:hypothetical protein